MRPAAALLALGLLWGAPCLAGGDPCAPACKELRCELDAARCLIERGRAREAKERLRPLAAEHPGEREPGLLLARAYLALGNAVWARRVLYGALQHEPKSCELRAWLVWVHLQKAELDQARDLLGEPGCPGSSPSMRGRFHLLRATLARYEGDRKAAAAALARAREIRALLPEDRELFLWLERHVHGDRAKPLDLRAELGAGYTTNGLMSSPVDPQSGSQSATGSPAMTLDLLARFEPPWGKTLRPMLEGSLRGLGLLDEAVRDYSYFDLGLRPGVILGSLQLAYSAQLFLLTGGDRYDRDGPRVFYESHRGELEWNAAAWTSLWLGAGRSIFRELARSRTELDGGGGLTGRLWRLRLVGALSLRGQWATNDAYDRYGGTLVGSATLPLSSFSLRGRLVLGLDLYPSSAGYFDPQNHRRDLLVKGGVELWSRPWRGLRAGLSYEASSRTSTVALYEYTDHRFLARLRWQLSLDPWAPRSLPSRKDHVALPYGVSGGGGGLEDERIRDLLRQEDAAQRGSTCID